MKNTTLKNPRLFITCEILIMAFILLIAISMSAAQDLSATQDLSANKATRQDALLALNSSELIILEMEASNISSEYMKDALIEARMVFEQASYAQILRGEVSSTAKELKEAEDALRLVRWSNITYADVLPYAEKIRARKTTALLLLDKLRYEESRNDISSDKAREILAQAKTAFSEERYNDTDQLLKSLDKQIEEDKAQASTISGLQKSASTFFETYWQYILLSLLLLAVIGYWVSRRIAKASLEKAILRMKSEETATKELIVKTQEERYKSNKISGMVYNIRMKAYREKIEEINEELPVLKEKLKRFKI
jgi:hypothetical protein